MDMERIRREAQAYYAGSTEDQKQLAQRFFEAMDADKNGNISVDEFSTVLTSAGFQSEKFDWLFGKLDKDNNGTLDFEEMLTFFYILGNRKYRNQLKSQANTKAWCRKAKSAGRKLRHVPQLFIGLLNAYGLALDTAELQQDGCSIL